MYKVRPYRLSRPVLQQRAQRRYRARLLHQEGLSFSAIALSLRVSRSEAWRLVHRVPKAGPLPVKGMVRRAA